MQEFQENLEGETEGESVNGPNEMTFTLKRSGKTIRRLSAGIYSIIFDIQTYECNQILFLCSHGIELLLIREWCIFSQQLLPSTFAPGDCLAMVGMRMRKHNLPSITPPNCPSRGYGERPCILPDHSFIVSSIDKKLLIKVLTKNYLGGGVTIEFQ